MFAMCATQNASSPAAKDAQKKKEKEEAEPEVTPLEKMLQTAGAVREDGSDKFFGMENVSFTRSSPSIYIHTCANSVHSSAIPGMSLVPRTLSHSPSQLSLLTFV